MEAKRIDVGQVYGYAACLVAVLTFLFSVGRMTSGILDIRELPYSPAYAAGPSLVSPEAYRIDLLSRITTESGSAAVLSSIAADSTWQRMYQMERLHRLALSHQTSRTQIVVHGVVALLAALLFAGHGRWLRERERERGASSA